MRSAAAGFAAQLVLVHAEDAQVGRWRPEVRDPRAHEVEDVASDAQLLVELADRRDGVVVDVRDQTGRRVELGVVGLVEPCEELGREAAALGVTRHGPRVERYRHPCGTSGKRGSGCHGMTSELSANQPRRRSRSSPAVATSSGRLIRFAVSAGSAIRSYSSSPS